MARTYAIAHRGIPAFEVENSMASFDRALDYASVLEVDVRVTRDGVPVCAHDASLERTHGDRSRIASMTYRELHAVAPEIVRLYDLLSKHGRSAGWFIDIKVRNPRAVEQIVQTLEGANIELDTGAALRAGQPLKPGTACIESPDAILLQSLGSRTGGGRLELVRGASTKRELAITAPFITAYAHGVVLPDALATRSLVMLLRNLKLGVYVYTIDDPIRAMDLAKLGVSGIFTDFAHEVAPALTVI
jgi:glycerophosphoryl diester phosphodiesterase